MNDVPRLKLSDFFKRFAPKFVLGTSYTASPVFFETSILPKIDRRKLEGAVVLCDVKGFRMAAQEVGALRAASTIYSLIYPDHPGAFHPKVWIMADEARVAVLCGSGNLTQSGFIDNLELFDAFEILHEGQDRELCGEIADFVEGLMNLWPPQERRERAGLRTLSSLHRLLATVRESNEEAASRRIWFLSSFKGGFGPQLAGLVHCRELRIAAPYFGGGLEGVKNLAGALGADLTEVFPAEQSQGVDLDPAALAAWQGAPLRQLDIQSASKGDSGRFAHLKLYGMAGRDGSHFSMTGSVNGTMAALEGKNVEAAILRKISGNEFDSLFSARIPKRLPSKVIPDYSDGGEGWIGTHATLKDAGLVLSVSEAYRARLPIKEVTVTWICGPNRVTSSLGTLFEGGPVERLGTDRFPSWLAAGQNASALEFRGISPAGEDVRSFALVESYADLMATPLQRNAAAAIRSLLSGESSPEIAGLNAVWQLFSRTLDTADLDEGPGEGSNGSRKGDMEPPGSHPIWPPEAAGVTASGGKSHAGTDVLWFQRILSSLLREGRKDDSRAAEVSADTDTEGEEGGQKSRPPKNVDPSKTSGDLARSIRAWQTAEYHHWLLSERLRAAVVYARPDLKGNRARQFELPNKERLLPIACGTFLIALILHPGDLVTIDGVPVVRRSELILDFLRLMVDDRRQAESVAIPKGHPYRFEVFPPILEDVRQDPDMNLDRELVILFVGLFAMIHADGGVPRGRLPVMEWLRFRHFVGPDLVLDASTKGEVIAQVARHVPSFHRDSLLAALDEMDRTSWKDFAGDRHLRSIFQAAAGEEVAPQDSAGIDHWADFLRRLQRKATGAPVLVVNRFFPVCTQVSCRSAHIRRPELARIGNLIPCICPSCGTALIPDLLQDVTKSHEN